MPTRSAESARKKTGPEPATTDPTKGAGDDPGTNCVVLRGRVTSAPTVRELPSGDTIVTFRLSVSRTRTAMTARSKASSDWVDCSAWTARTRRTVERWQVGASVEVHGALRRRFYRAAARSTTRLEVEVLQARQAGRS
jgi:single-strand DNA-binding protein